MKRRLVALSLGLVFSASFASADGGANDRVWTVHPRPDARSVRPQFGAPPRSFKVAAVDPAELHAALSQAPLERATQSLPMLSLPMPDGSFVRVEIEQSPILSAEMQARYPDIHTFRCQGVDDRNITGRLDETAAGFHALLLTDRGAVYIDPADQKDLYISYWNRDIEQSDFHCFNGPGPQEAFKVRPLTNPVGTQLRTYRVAISATSAYTQFYGGSIPLVASEIATMMNRVTAIFERELSIRLLLVTAELFFDKATDPFAHDDIDHTVTDNQTVLDAHVGSGAYDIGHVFDTRLVGGKGEIGSACDNARKAQGVSTFINDVHDVTVVAHEMGHQLGATHSFDTNNTGSCGPERTASSAYEPGGGSTLMSYAGRCEDRVQQFADEYFHTGNFDQITNYVNGGGSACGTVTLTGNHPPAPTSPATVTIPPSTPFTLTGSATDPDGDALTFSWEQFDLGTGIRKPTPTYTGPLFRSYPATSSPLRTFPPMSALIAGTPTPFEVLPATFHDYTFRMTARDNRGGSDYSTTRVHVNGAPFILTAPVGPLECAGSSFLQWIGGSGEPFMRALLSTDNGQTFPTTLRASAPNTDFATFDVPRVLSNQAWIRLEPVGNVYFSLRGPLSIVDTVPPTVTAPASAGHIECRQCSPRGARVTVANPPRAEDACDPSPVISSDGPEVFPLGNTTVTWSGRDASGNVGTAPQFVEVVDTTPPSLTVPANVVAQCTATSGTTINLGTPIVDDVCWCSQVTVTNNAPALFPLGTTTVTWTATDGSGNVTTATQNVTIGDTLSPTLDVVLRPNVLWPPNKKFYTIEAKIITHDLCAAAPTVRLLAIESNEPGRDDIRADIGTDDREFQVRAWRLGGGNGRIYTVTYESRDASGNSTVKQATVTVPIEPP